MLLGCLQLRLLIHPGLVRSRIAQIQRSLDLEQLVSHGRVEQAPEAWAAYRRVLLMLAVSQQRGEILLAEEAAGARGAGGTGGTWP